jgi:hypothetical protein
VSCGSSVRDTKRGTEANGGPKMATWQMRDARSPTNLIGMGALMDLFGPWLLPLFGVGTVMLAGGLLTKEMASDRSIKRLGRGAANAGWRLMLLAAAMYLVVLALAAVFDNMISNLPGT